MAELASQNRLVRRTSTVASTDLAPTFEDRLQQLFRQQLQGQLVVSSGPVRWVVCLHEGKIFYASHSVDPAGRLEVHLQKLSRAVPTLAPGIRARARTMMAQLLGNASDRHAYYRVMDWLLTCGYLTKPDAKRLTEDWIAEAMESLLLVDDGCCSMEPAPETPRYSLVDPSDLLRSASERLKAWFEFGIEGASPYQRPYLFNQALAKERLSQPIHTKLAAVLRGESFAQLAAKLNRSALDVMKGFFPHISNGTIVLREPHPPFDRLPRITPQAIRRLEAFAIDSDSEEKADSGEKADPAIPTRLFTVVCVDDSPAILNQLSRFLDGDRFQVHTISNPLRAMMSITRIKPDAVLLDIGMPGIDGYELCRLIRNHSAFKETPIFMVTGHSGIFNRARARMVGASGYLTKPFTQVEILKLLAKHLERN